MSVEIVETIKRQCCAEKDRKPYRGETQYPHRIRIEFCSHCGQIWVKDRNEFDGVESYCDWRKFVIGD